MDAYLATLADVQDKAALKKTLEDLFNKANLTIAAEKWTVVEFNGSDKATFVASMTTEVDANGTKTNLRGVIMNDAEKVEGKWLLNVKVVNLVTEQL